STVYKHYEKPRVVIQNDVVKYVFRCKSAKTEIVRARYDTATTNLVNHRDSCEKRVAPPEQAITAYLPGGHYNKGEFRVHRALWIGRRNRPHRSITDPEFKKMLLSLNTNALLQSRQTVSRDIIRIHNLSTPHIASILQQHKGFLHISFDGWTAPNVLSFFGIDVHYADERGNLVSFTLDFVP
ncbi:hypothetical protein K435DRAFT_682070, partial [Dendrothele bispora CBS 962.96]